MKRFFTLLTVFLFAACHERSATTRDEHADHATAATTTDSVAAAQPNSPAAQRGTAVTFRTANDTASGYLSLPETAAGMKPAVIVIQEWWGLDDYIRGETDRLAGQGYVALAVDLYRGRSTKDPAEAHELMRGLPEDRALADLRGAFDYLASREDVDRTRIASIGWCMGGGYSLALAAAEPKLNGAVINYGRLITDTSSLKQINAAILGNFGGKDRGIPVADVERFTQQMKELGKPIDVKIYPDAGHAFMNPGNTEGYSQAAAEDATKRIDAFLAQRLSPQGRAEGR